MFRRIFTLILLAVASFAYSLPENAEFRIAGSTEGYSRKRLYMADDYYRLSLVESEKKRGGFQIGLLCFTVYRLRQAEAQRFIL